MTTRDLIEALDKIRRQLNAEGSGIVGEGHARLLGDVIERLDDQDTKLQAFLERPREKRGIACTCLKCGTDCHPRTG